MVARVGTVAFLGIEVVEVDVQAQLAAGLPAFTVVGLPDKAVGESRERVKAAFAALGLAEAGSVTDIERIEMEVDESESAQAFAQGRVQRAAQQVAEVSQTLHLPKMPPPNQKCHIVDQPCSSQHQVLCLASKLILRNPFLAHLGA